MHRYWRKICLTGPVAVILAWIIILSSWYFNKSWFIFTRDAFSDFGGSTSCCPGLYNYGLELVGVTIILFSICLYKASRDKLEVVGASYIGLSGIFLALIGYYHAGTRPHGFVSTWFFIQMDLGLFFQSLGLYRMTGSWESYSSLWTSIAAFPIAIIIGITLGWPSAAVLEAYGIIVIDVIVILITIAYNRVFKDISGP